MKIARFTALALLLPGLVSAGGTSVDWSRWRGPAATSITTQDGWKAETFAARLRVAWRANVGRGHSAVTVRGDRLYTMGYQVTTTTGEKVAEEIVYCLSAKTGREIWRYAYRTTEQDWPGPASTPVLDGSYLYTTGRRGEVTCFDAATGVVVWKRHLVDERLAQRPNWGFCASPVVDGNLLLLNAGRSGVALDTRTGKVVWASEPQTGGLPSPVVFERNGQRLAAIGGRGAVNVVDVATGKVQWTHPWQSDADPSVLGDHVLLTGGGRANGSALLQAQGQAPQPVWSNPNLAGSFQSAVVLGGHAYGFGRAGQDQVLQSIEVGTGALKWSRNLGAWGSLIAVNDILVVIDGDGDMVLAEASPKAYRELTRLRAINITPAESADDRDLRACWTNPAFAEGRIFVRDNFGEVVCVEPKV